VTAQSPLVIDDADRGLFRVHRSAFVDDEILRLERERIFDKTWLYVGHESEVPRPGDFHTRKVGGRQLIFTRDKVGQVQVLLNSCRHRGAEVCREPNGNKKVFTCFYHGWAYGTDGALVSVPDGESYSEGFLRAEHGLAKPRVESYRGFVFATYSAETEPLVEFLADAVHLFDLVADQSAEGMELVAGTHQYTMKANWKLLMENSCDGYHGFTVHQTYFEMMMNLGITPGLVAPDKGLNASFDLGNGHAVACSPELGMPLMNPEIKAATDSRRAAIADRLGEDHAVRMLNTSRNTIVFPNFAIIDLNFGIQLRTMYPTAVDHTEITGWQLMPKGVSEDLASYRLDNALTFWGPAGLATPDDVEGLDQCQRGFSTVNEVPWSDISRGMKSAQPTATDELQMRTFWRKWNQVLTGEAARREGPAYDTTYLLNDENEAEAS